MYGELYKYTHDKKHLLRLCILRLLPDKAIEILRNIKHKKNPFKKNSIADKRGFFNLGNSPDLFSDFALGEDASFIWSAENSHWMESNPYQHLGQKDIEVWHPFYDIRLVEFMLQLPPKYKYNEGIHKRILRDAMRGILPDLVENAVIKQSFPKL